MVEIDTESKIPIWRTFQWHVILESRVTLLTHLGLRQFHHASWHHDFAGKSITFYVECQQSDRAYLLF